MDAAEVAIISVLVLPPAGTALAAALEPRLGRTSLWFAPLSCVGAAGAAAIYGTAEHTLTVGRWFHIESSLPDAALRLRLDPLAAAVLVPMLLAASVLAWPRFNDDRAGQRTFQVRMALLLFASVGLVLSTNLLFVLLFWQATALAGSSLLHPPRAPATSERMLMIHRAPDLLFFIGILLAWHHFGSLDLEAIRTRLAASPGDFSPAVPGAIALCLFAAAAARCAQFPLFLWLDDLAAVAPGAIVAVFGVLVAPTAFYLIVRANFLLTVSTEAPLVIAGIGTVTVLLAPAVALVETRWSAIVSYCGAALFGWMFVGLATGSAAGVTGAAMLLAIHCVAAAALVANDPRGTHVVITATILACGMWGQNLILAAAWPTAGIETVSRLPAAPVLLMLLFLGQVLLAFALFRGVFLARRPEIGASTGKRGRFPAVLLVAAAIAILAIPLTADAWLIRLLSAAAVSGSLVVEPAALLPGLLAALLGIVAAWMIYAHPSAWAERLTTALTPVVITAQRRLYFEEVLSFALVLPVLALAHAARFLDRSLLERLVIRTPNRLPAILARAAHPLEERPVQFAALTVLLAAGVLLLVTLSTSGR